MKKILSLSAAAAVLSLTAVAASADIVATDNGTAPTAGGQYVVDIVVDGEFPLVSDLAATQFTVQASENLTLESFTKTTTGMAEFNQDRMSFTYANSEAPADGTVLLSLVFTVDAAAEEEVSVAIVPDAGFEAGVNADAITAVVVEDGESAISDVPFSTEPAPEPSTEPALEETEPAITVEPSTETPDQPTNPDTGIALAVVPALVAGAAAVVAAKKRK